MIKQFILCNWCEADLTDEKSYIVINGSIHYCNSTCRRFAQSNCEATTNHKNSIKDKSQGKCLDCGLTYAEPSL